MSPLDAAVTRRLSELTRTARMWGSPEELECVAQHFTHLLLTARTPGWTFEQTLARWKPLAGDPEEHAAMRARLWGQEVETARSQVVQGFVVVWAGLERKPELEGPVGAWIETLLDGPERAGPPDRLNMVLFALMGFVARQPQRYVQALSLERHRIGGHELRPLPVVAPFGPSDAGLTYTRNFQSWPQVIDGINQMAAALQAQASPSSDSAR